MRFARRASSVDEAKEGVTENPAPAVPVERKREAEELEGDASWLPTQPQERSGGRVAGHVIMVRR